MRRRHHSLKDRILAILERVADLWANTFFLFVTIPALDPSRLTTRDEFEDDKRLIYKADAHNMRAIHKTALRLAGLPRIACPIEAFCGPQLKSTAAHLRALSQLRHEAEIRPPPRHPYGLALAARDRRRTRDPLRHLRADLNATAGACLPLSRCDWADGLSRRSAAKAEGGLSEPHVPNARARL